MPRIDVSSSGSFERRSDPALPADFVRNDINQDGVWVETWDWQGQVYLKTSTGLSAHLGSRNGNNPHAVRRQNSGVFNVYRIYTPNGINNVGALLQISADGTHVQGGPFPFDAEAGGSQGIRDVTTDGQIIWQQPNGRIVDGFTLLDAKERGDYIVGVFADTWLGVSIFRKSMGDWFRVYPYDLALIPGLAENGTVAVSAEPGGFIPKADWLTRPFNPHVIDPPPPDPEEKHMIAYQSPVLGFLPGELVAHPDGASYKGIRKPNGKVVACTPDGKLEEREALGAWERFRVSANGASLIAEREGGKVYILPLVQ
jgi:hypothetical protein